MKKRKTVVWTLAKEEEEQNWDLILKEAVAEERKEANKRKKRGEKNQGTEKEEEIQRIKTEYC